MKRTRLIDLTGKRFGQLVVVSRVADVWPTKWICQCDCGNTSTPTSQALRRGAVMSCGCVGKNRRGVRNPNWSGYGEISGNTWYCILSRAAGKRGGRVIPFDLTIEYAWDLFLQQERKCALTGMSIGFGEKNADGRTASLDRIDSSKGYIESNVQWVHKDVNRMKSAFPQDYYIQVCKLVAARRP
jgi:hypothetical protein